MNETLNAINEERTIPKAILFDSSKCMGCRGCQVACKQWWELPAVSSTNRGTYENPFDLSSETWNKIRFKEIGYNGAVKWLFTRQSCMHCTTAVCVWVCPAYARKYHSLGYVIIDQERCIGCGRCVTYCPYEVPRLGRQNVSHRMLVELGASRTVSYNCNFCGDRVEDGFTPACVKACPSGALVFGERADLVKQSWARVGALKTTYPKAHLYGEQELGGLHVMYILTEEPYICGMPDKPQLGTYPEFDENMFPTWYIQAIANSTFPVFPPEARSEWYLRPKPGSGWIAQALWSLPALWVIVGGIALWWITVRRRMLKGKNREDTTFEQ